MNDGCWSRIRREIDKPRKKEEFGKMNALHSAAANSTGRMKYECRPLIRQERLLLRHQTAGKLCQMNEQGKERNQEINLRLD